MLLLAESAKVLLAGSVFSLADGSRWSVEGKFLSLDWLDGKIVSSEALRISVGSPYAIEMRFNK